MVGIVKTIKDKLNQISVKNFIFSCLFLIILLFILVYPAAKKMSLLGQQIRELKNSALAQEKNESEIQDTADEYKKYEPKLNLLNEAIISRNRELEFITLLEEKAILRDLEQKININEVQAIEGTGYSKIPLIVSLTGKFNDELDYLQDLEKISFYINIKKITLSTSAENSATTTNMVLLADTFWR